MATIKEHLDKLTDLKHRLAVWEALHEFLDDGGFVSKDEGRPASRAIQVPDCVVPVVPEETIESILQSIAEGPLQQLRDQISELENQTINVVGG